MLSRFSYFIISNFSSWSKYLINIRKIRPNSKKDCSTRQEHSYGIFRFNSRRSNLSKQGSYRMSVIQIELWWQSSNLIHLKAHRWNKAKVHTKRRCPTIRNFSLNRRIWQLWQATSILHGSIRIFQLMESSIMWKKLKTS